MDDLIYAGRKSVSLSGASSGVIALGSATRRPYAIGVAAELRSNSGYKLSVGLCDVGTSGTNFAAKQTNAAPFTDANQPGGAGIKVKSSNAADVSIPVTVYGTVKTTGALTSEILTTNATNGTTASALSTQTDFDDILGFEIGAAATGNILVCKADGSTVIGTLTTPATQIGVYDVPAASQAGYDLPVSAVGDAAGTLTVGIIGTDAFDQAQLAAIALNATTPVIFQQCWRRVTKLLFGATGVGVTFSTAAMTWQTAQYSIGDGGDSEEGLAVLFNTEGNRYLWWVLANGTTPANGGASDYMILRAYKGRR